MGDILKEAIADAKAVRETALENAKMALEEAFTPQIKSMLSAKLKEEELEEDEVPVTEEEDEDEAEEGMREEDDEEEVPAEEGEGHDDEVEEDDEDEEEVEEEALDLEAVIRELESELSEAEDDEEEVEESTETSEEPVSEGDEEIEEEYEIDEAALTEEDDDEDDKEEVDEELDKSSDIGKSDNNRGSTDTSSGIGGGKKGMKESALEAELKEYKEAVSFLKDKLHEVNILNAKLLFTNKLFKAYSLDNNQKLKVVETFDRAQTTREIKLVYSTLAEQFSDNGSIVTKKSISESASSAVSSTKPSKESRKVISEETQVADRFRKLAGLIK